MIASVAGTMIAQAAQAMEFGATSEDIAYTCHAHPTHSEAVKEAAMAVTGKPIHIDPTRPKPAARWPKGSRGGRSALSARLFDAAYPPADFRRKTAVWQVTLADGTHVYVGRDSGEIEAVRTRWWRLYDFFWGLHILDPAEREDTSHPLLWVFSVLALGSSLLGTVLLFRRRRALKR
jgi:hypothetical protein